MKAETRHLLISELINSGIICFGRYAVLTLAAVVLLESEMQAHVRMLRPTAEERMALEKLNAKTPTGEVVLRISSNSYYVCIKATEILSNRRDKEGACVALPDRR